MRKRTKRSKSMNKEGGMDYRVREEASASVCYEAVYFLDVSLDCVNVVFVSL